MTFLELCQKVALESGTIAGIPSFTTLAGATGRLAKLAGWVSDANRDIENERSDWLWMRETFTKALVIGQTEYTPVSWNLEVRKWLPENPRRRPVSIYDPAIGASDEGELSYIPFDYWRSRYDFGDHDATRPGYWSISPQRSFLVGPKPDKAYVIRGQYVRKAQILELDNDEPGMPEEFHGIIVAEALRLMASSDEAFDVLAEKAQRYERQRSALVNDQTDDMPVMWGGTLGR
jgi:hypothetical protein